MFPLADVTRQIKGLCISILFTLACVCRVSGTEISAIVRRLNNIELVHIDTVAKNVTFLNAFINDVEAKFTASIAVSINSRTLVYNEPWSRSKYDRIRVLPFGDKSDNTVLNANSGIREIRRRTAVSEELITSLSLDWLTGNIYVAVEQTGSLQNPTRIEVCPISFARTINASSESNASNCAVILHGGLDGLHSLVVDPIDGYMYWLSRVHGRIERAWMDGRHLDHNPYHEVRPGRKQRVETSRGVLESNSADVSDKSPVSFGLTLDSHRRALYFIRAIGTTNDDNESLDFSYDQEVVMCRLYDRTSCRIVTRTTGASALAPFQNMLFWTTYGSKTSTGLRFCALDNCTDELFSVANSRDIESLSFLESSMQPQRVTPNPCVIDNGGCSHICLLTPGAPWYNCACPVGIRLTDNGALCETTIDSAPLQVLFVASTNGLFYISLDTDDRIVQAVSSINAMPSRNLVFNDHEAADALGTSNYLQNAEKTVELRQSQGVAMVDFDPVSRYVYWLVKSASDGTHSPLSMIYRSYLNGSDYTQVLTDTIKIDSFAVDWLSGNLLWADGTNNRIELMSLQNGYRKNFLTHRLLQPRSLMYDALNYRVYFVNLFQGDTQLEYVTLDGSRRETLMIFPKSIRLCDVVVVPEHKSVFWSDRERANIFKAHWSDKAENAEIVAVGLRIPNSITKLGSRMFYNTLGARFVTELLFSEGENAVSRVHNEFSESEIFGQTSLKAMELNVRDASLSVCLHGDIGCNHICIQTGNSSQSCVCAAGFELLLDGRACRRSDEFLAVGETGNMGDLWRISADLQKPSDLEHFAISPLSISSIGVQQQNGYLYWSASNPSKYDVIFRTSFDGRHTEVFLETTGLRNICGVVVDSVFTGNVFICNGAYRRIEVISYTNPELRRSLFWSRNSRPNLLAIHSAKRTLFFTLVHSNSTVDICALQYDIISAEHLPVMKTLVVTAGNVTALTLDESGDRIFWTTSDNSNEGWAVVLSAVIGDLSSSVSFYPIVWAKSRRLVPIAIAFGAQGMLYMLNQRSAGVTIDTIDVSSDAPSFLNSMSTSRVTLHTLYSQTALHNRKFSQLAVVSTRKIDHAKQRDCSKKDGSLRRSYSNCICMPKLEYSMPQCICADQSQFNELDGTCRAPQNFLLLGTADRFLRFTLKKDDTLPKNSLMAHFIFDHDAPIVLPISGISRPVALAIDVFSIHPALYWIDETGELKSAVDDAPNMAVFADMRNAANCEYFYDVDIDIFSRQLFASCARYKGDNYGFIHAWRIQSNNNLNRESSLKYLGCVVDGSRTKRLLPKEIALSVDSSALFYVDHSAKFDSPSVFRCNLDGRNCVYLISTGFRAEDRTILRTAGSRLFYSTANGIWSRSVHFEPNFSLIRADKFTNDGYDNGDVQHHLIWDDDDANEVKNLVVLDESLALVVINGTKNCTRLLHLHSSSFKYVPHYLKNLPSAAIPFDSVALENQLLYSVVAVFSNNFQRNIVSTYRTPCSHISAPTPAMRYALRTGAKLWRSPHKTNHDLSDNDDSDMDEDEEDENFKETLVYNTAENVRQLIELSQGDVECLCPFGYSIASDDHMRCEKNVVCASWQFACRNGRSCIHIAQRCNQLSDCADNSDEDAATCPFYFKPTISPAEFRTKVVANNSRYAMAVPLDWMCDDGATVIRKYLLCDGKADCADGSDETYCRCVSPAENFDCSAWEYHHHHKHNSILQENCILRAALCDGKDHCRYGSDERAQLCAAISDSFILPSILTALSEYKYLIGAVFILLFILCAVCYICVVCASKKRSTTLKRRLTTSNAVCSQVNALYEQYPATLNNEREIEPLLNAETSSTAYPCVINNNHLRGRLMRSQMHATELPQNAGKWLSIQPNNYEVIELQSTQVGPSRASEHRESSRVSQFSQSAPFCRCAKCVEMEAAILPLQTQRSISHFQQQRHPVTVQNYLDYNLQPILCESAHRCTSSHATTSGGLSAALLPAPLNLCECDTPVQQNMRFYAPPPSAVSDSTYGIARVIPTASAGLLALKRDELRQTPAAHVNNSSTTSNSMSVRSTKRKLTTRRFRVRYPHGRRHDRQRAKMKLVKNLKNIVDNLSDEFIPSPPLQARSAKTCEERLATPVSSTPLLSEEERDLSTNFFNKRMTVTDSGKLPPPPPSSIRTSST